MTLKRGNTMDATQPAEGQRILLGDVTHRLLVSVADLAKATDLSRSAAGRLYFNEWPRSIAREEIERLVREYLATRGAEPDELETLFFAKLRSPTNSTFRAHPKLRTPIAQPTDTTNPEITTKEVTDMLLAKQTLTQDARKHFGIVMNPYDGEVTSAEEMFSSGEYRFVREVLWQTATTGRFTGVFGESGSGKTSLLADFRARVFADNKPIILIEPSVLGMEDTDSKGKTVKSADILTAIVSTLDPLGSVAQTTERRTRQAEKLLTESTATGNTHLLLIEEAHGLPIATLKHLKRLHERMRFQGRKPMLGILLLGQPELQAKLDEKRHDVREVVQRIEMVQLRPLGADLKAYLAHRAKRDSKDLQALITDDGIDALRDRLTVVRGDVRTAPVSLIYPLSVNNAMTAALNAAARIGAPVITKDVVRAI
jgi:type II secretory pathway predicted ATPase ExeA